MPNSFDYSQYARRFATGFPVFNYLLTQIRSWVIAYLFLAIITYLELLVAGTRLHASTDFSAHLLMALYFGFFNGITSGYAGLVFEKKFYNKALWVIILGKAIISFVFFVILISIAKSVVYPYLMARFFQAADVPATRQSWDAFFQLLLIYNIIVGLVISFINQVNKKYGPG